MKVKNTELVMSNISQIACIVSLTVKVAVLAEQIFCTVIFSTYGIAQDIVKDAAELISSGYTIYTTSVELSKLSDNSEQRIQKVAMRAVAISAFSLASLDLVSKTYMQVSGAKYVVLTATTVIQVSKHVIGYSKSVEKSKIK